MNKLLHDVREFWFNNIEGDFLFDMIAGEKHVSRAAIHKYGGPAPEFSYCEICQKSEWASRLLQTNMFIRHTCRTAKRCHEVCEKQGNDKWTNWFQNFHFAEGWNNSLNAPQCLLLLPEGQWKLYSRWYGHRCDFAWLNLARQLAQACQIEVRDSIKIIKSFSDYDLLFMVATGDNVWTGKRPDIPIVMMGWDFWHGTEMYQREIDLWQPDYFLSSALCGWKRNLKWPKHTKFRFYPVLPGNFFARPNLGKKQIDLLVIGDIFSGHGWYDERGLLNRQIELLTKRHKIEFSHLRGGGRFMFEGPLEFTVNGTRKFTTGIKVETRWPLGKRVRFLNKWNEYLGAAKYVIFGPMSGISPQIVIRKHGEALASGAIPIMPKSRDLKYFGVEAMKHYIPLSQVWKQNSRLEELLMKCDRYKYIAENAVRWHEDNADGLLFDGFEDLVQEITKRKYPRRLI